MKCATGAQVDKLTSVYDVKIMQLLEPLKNESYDILHPERRESLFRKLATKGRDIRGEQVHNETQVSPARTINGEIVPEDGEGIYVIATLNGLEKLKLLDLTCGVTGGAFESKDFCCEVFPCPMLLAK